MLVNWFLNFKFFIKIFYKNKNPLFWGFLNYFLEQNQATKKSEHSHSKLSYSEKYGWGRKDVIISKFGLKSLFTQVFKNEWQSLSILQ